MIVDCVLEARAALGEGPLWHPGEQALYWIDIKAPALHRLDPASGREKHWPLPEAIGSFCFREAGGLVLALRSGLAFLDPESGGITPVARPDEPPGNRFNDGKCDRAGRFFAGTMDDAETACSGALYRLDPDRSLHRIRSDVYISNGLGWSTDDRVMYFTDSPRQVIWAYDYDIVTGRTANERVFARIAEDAGYPDGLCVDAEDHVWSAHWDGARLTRWRPDGSIERVVPMPVPRPTSCCFGGPDLATLYVTSARTGLDERALAAAPLAGGVFALEPGVRGQPTAFFAG
ncbi:SMP-30/gluconolactonase/LRE family protein [Marinimicrococcus flavescens]|uniref:SMP-30/gluconolactonase/LRE family protein n=1 Tax=Marinimicrococcus flavescens TaxID=3031815 RepID=A0AAP3UZ13_9PROT|nr:SMP-30/gluconolactonase/LRE family protein [Marinimicrococcus flavescens]